MPVPMVCFTCGKYINDDYKKYIDLYKQYEQDKINDNNLKESPAYYAMRDLSIWKLCCRKMFISTHCVDDIIL